jgi:hypothetical protein
MDPEKLKKLLQSLRKAQGYLTGLTWSQMGEVFTVLDPGWKLEKIVGLVKGFDGESEYETFYGSSQAEAEKRHQELAKSAVLSLPSSPKANELYILDLGEVLHDPRRDMYKFSCKPWLGAEGWRITSHTGKQLDVFPDRFRFGELRHGYRATTRGKIPVYDALSRMKKETDWLDQINKSLNEDEFVPSAKRTRDSTGSCSVCFQNVKITNGRNIVLHGYKRPGTGYAHGECEGTRFPAFELSIEGTKSYLEKGVRPSIARNKEYLARINQDALEEIPTSLNRTIRRTDKGWAIELARLKEKTEQLIGLLEADEKSYEKLIQNWKPRPLPKEGDRHINWFYAGQTD